VARVILTGFMATGKTEVGRRLARALACPFVDTDDLVQAKAGRTIAEIFAVDGEPHFRALERQAVEQACAMSDAVVATGGGTMLDADNRRRLAAAGPIVCLAATPEDILARVGDPATRPLLAGRNGVPAQGAGSDPKAPAQGAGSGVNDTLARIRALLAERASAYALATHTIPTSGLDVDSVVERVRALVAGPPVAGQ
jgi:shikimate kinase